MFNFQYSKKYKCILTNLIMLILTFITTNIYLHYDQFSLSLFFMFWENKVYNKTKKDSCKCYLEVESSIQT